jgi:hypothetical protein
MSPRFYLLPLVIVGAGVVWLVGRGGHDGPETVSVTVEIPRVESDWCREGTPSRGGWYCEVREFTFSPSGAVTLDASPNGSIDVRGWNRGEVHLLAKVEGKARSDDLAYRLVSEVQIGMGQEVKASGPKTGRGESWWVSYRANVPGNVDMELSAMNGSIAIEDVAGTLRMTTVNGGISLGQVSGDVTARTVNGGIKAQLAGASWDGAGLELRATNGGIEVAIPDEYNAVLEAATTNGGIQVDFPVTVTGRITRRLNTTLGNGGATISATTTNGAVKFKKHQAVEH